jgi:hypothetical protein
MPLCASRAFLSLVNDTNKRESRAADLAVDLLEFVVEIFGGIFEGLSGLFDIFTFL